MAEPTAPRRHISREIAITDQAHATRVSIGLVIPGIALVIADHPGLIIYTVFGSFTGMYGRADRRSLRLLHQTQGAILLLAGTVVGVLLSQHHAAALTVVVVASVFAIGGSMLADFFALRPEGPFYGIFALGALAGVPADLAPAWVELSIAIASAALAIAIGQTVKDREEISFRGVIDVFREQRVRTRPAAMLHSVRYAVAVAAAGLLAWSAGLSHVNWAIAGAAVTLAAADPRGRLQRGLHRLLGTVAGLAVTAVILLPHFGPRTLAIIVILLIFPTELFMAVNYTLALSFFTPMIMLMTKLADPIGLKELLTTRALGTMIGVVAGLVVTYLVRDRRSWATVETGLREH